MFKRNQKLLWVIAAGTLAGLGVRAQTSFTILHSFADSTADGSDPVGQPVLIGPSLYGFASTGGSTSKGALFQVNTNGTGSHLVFSFAGGTNGANPFGSPVLSAGAFYGMTTAGGSNDGGVAFSVNTNGTNYRVLHTFLGGNSDGVFPFGSVTVGATTLYGMTINGGINDKGVIFKMNTNGSAFALLHSFSGPPGDGSFPNEGVALAGSALYGTTFNGGTSDLGTLFALGTNGSGFTVLHSFTGGTNDGANPSGLLTVNGPNLYGIATFGGTNNLGVVYAINTNGTGFTLLHHFVGGIYDGALPQFGPLQVANSLLYGSTGAGGPLGGGVVFQMTTGGANYRVLHTCFGGTNDGAFADSPPILSGAALYGVTDNGGSNDLGVLYSMPSTSVTNSGNFRITSITLRTNDVTINWLTSGGHRDVVQFTPGDVNGSYTNDFMDLSGLIIVPGSGAVTTNITDVGGARGRSSGYYRVRFVP